MALWAGIDEAGYGPRLGPLVVSGTAFLLSDRPKEGVLWDLLRDAIARRVRGSAGRVVVNDSKLVYSRSSGLMRLEEGVLAFLAPGDGGAATRASNLLAALRSGGPTESEPQRWFAGAHDMELPVASNVSAVESKASVVQEAMDAAGVQMLGARAAVVFPAEFNRIVARTRNKSLLLFQKCGLILQEFWRMAGPGESYVLVDRHGGRKRYRRLLLDAFPACRCDILREEDDTSVYRVHSGEKSLVVAFKEGGDGRAVPTALASMTAKYVRELYMHAFNAYWGARTDGLKPTAGYWGDAGRFLRDIAPALEAEGADASELARVC